VRRKDLFLFFFLPFAGILGLFLVFSLLNRSFIQKKAEDLVHEQLLGAAGILKVSAAHLLDEGMAPRDVIALYSGEEGIYYMALLDGEKNILAWSSRYEGYLPYSARDAQRNAPWTIDSPAGRIFNLLAPFRTEKGTPGFLYLGYSLSGLEDMQAGARRNFLFFFAVLAAAGVVFFIGLFGLQRRYLEKEREAAAEKKEKERFREISAFTSAVAHEIKNPLNTLLLLFELLGKKAPDAMREDVGLGKEEVEKIARVIDRFSSYVKPLRLNRERVPLREIIEEARSALARGGEKDGVVFSYAETGPLVITADRSLLVQCLHNLIRNAFEATEAGTVAVTAKRLRRKILIQVEDTGAGLEPERAESVFEPFFTTKGTGMGVGLYLARRIVEAHEGRIWLESEPGKGTTFFIQMPGD
jgi:signal transduction histidine kinase